MPPNTSGGFLRHPLCVVNVDFRFRYEQSMERSFQDRVYPGMKVKRARRGLTNPYAAGLMECAEWGVIYPVSGTYYWNFPLGVTPWPWFDGTYDYTRRHQDPYPSQWGTPSPLITRWSGSDLLPVTAYPIGAQHVARSHIFIIF